MQDFNKIMKGFNSIVQKLEALATKKSIEKQAERVMIKVIEKRIRFISAEESSAIEVSAKLKELFTATKPYAPKN